MFVGHLGVALAAKNVRPEVPLWILVSASFGVDLLWPLLLLSGVETVRVDPGNTAFTHLDFEHYPWSHSLVMSVFWAALAGVLVFVALRSSRGALLAGGLVVSHWVLDLITHRPDLPLWPGGPLMGIGLWNSIAGTLLIEGALFVAGIYLYSRCTVSPARVGRLSLWALVAFTTVIWVSQPWSPAPPNPDAVAWVGVGMWLLPIWAAWIDGSRVRRTLPQRAEPGHQEVVRTS
jgi:hypothetical protein